MGAWRPFFMNPVPDLSLARANIRSTLATVYEKEPTLEREISGKVEEALPGVEVLAVELTEEGRKLLDRWAEALRRAQGTIRTFLERYEEGR